jgi:Tfp pilus assembly protein PilF
MKHLLWLLFLVAGLSACKQKVKSESDKQYDQYVAYEKIYSGYGKVPSDTTKLHIEQYLNSFPQDARAWSLLARLLYDRKEINEAIAAYRKTIAINPRYTVGYAGLGSIFNQQEMNDSAAYYLNKAVALHDSSAYTFLNLALLNMKTNHKAEALAFVDSTILTGDSSAAVFAGLSFVNHQLGEPEASAMLLQLAKELGLKDTLLFNEVLKGTVRIDSFYRKNAY